MKENERVMANRGISCCLLLPDMLVAPDHEEFVLREVLAMALQFSGDAKIPTGAGRQRRSFKHENGNLQIGCCHFNKKETKRLRKWALERVGL